jgi:hypothetical protein
MCGVVCWLVLWVLLCRCVVCGYPYPLPALVFLAGVRVVRVAYGVTRHRRVWRYGSMALWPACPAGLTGWRGRMDRRGPDGDGELLDLGDGLRGKAWGERSRIWRPRRRGRVEAMMRHGFAWWLLLAVVFLLLLALAQWLT